MNKGKVPKDIQEKVKNLKDYKKAQNDLKKMNTARAKIKSKKLNLRKVAHVIVAIAIFIAVVGLVIFAAASIGSWMGFFLVFV